MIGTILLSLMAVAMILGASAAIIHSKALAWVAVGLALATILLFVVLLLTFGG